MWIVFHIPSCFIHLPPELNPSAQRCLTRLLYWGFGFFKGLSARRLYKSFGVKGLAEELYCFYLAQYRMF
jgi:hypothetical protein